jgi:hypothetical protein
MESKKVILYEDESAAKFVENISGWVDVNRRFFGNNKDSEHMARYSSCTHMRCECGEIMTKGWTKCDKCREVLAIEKYNSRPFREYDGGIVYSDLADKYFRDSDEIEEYCEEEDLHPSELRLFLCVPNEFTEIDGDQWNDILPEDSEGELPKKLQDAINCLNEVIKSLPPASYSPSNNRTEYKPI